MFPCQGKSFEAFHGGRSDTTLGLEEILNKCLLKKGGYFYCPLDRNGKLCGNKEKRQNRARAHLCQHYDFRPYECFGTCGEGQW